MNIQLEQVRRRAVEKLQRLDCAQISEPQLGRAVMESLVEQKIDLRHGPSLDQMKQLLVDVLVAARRPAGRALAGV